MPTMQGKLTWLGLQHRSSFSFRTQLGLRLSSICLISVNKVKVFKERPMLYLWELCYFVSVAYRLIKEVTRLAISTLK